jgi:PiT family inorganic phosphate transporter
VGNAFLNLVDSALIAVALAFAWSMGAHYTGACMGMPYAARTIRLWPALWTMAILTLLGAGFLSHGVLATVGHHIIRAQHISAPAAIAIVGSAFVLTTIFNWLRVPTSTIQILVFCIAGAGLALGFGIHWTTIARLAVLWSVAPVAALILGYVITRLLDRLPWLGMSSTPLAHALVVVGAAASLTMGANDVSNATAVFLTTHLFGVFAAGLLGGLGLAVGVVTWGRPLLDRVAFDVVRMDLTMATAAQLVQALVVLTAVFFGYFTSMNQALIGAMAGAGLARGRETVQWPVAIGILKGWVVGPAAGLVLGYAAAWLLRLVPAA